MAEKRIIKVVEEYDDTRINEWEPYEQIAQCCQEIPGADECTDEGKVESWDGYPQSEDDWSPEEIYQQYKSQYGDRLIGYQVDSVGGPANGGPCGEQHTTWEGSLGCCDDPSVLLWGAHPGSVARDETYYFSASGGVEFQQFSGYSWSVVGTGLAINGNGLNARLRVDSCFCEPGLVICTDSCGQQIISVVSLSSGSWASEDDAYYQSDYGWEQDGTNADSRTCSEGVTIHGFNGGRTIHSQQVYGQICYTKATPQETEEVSIAGICAAGIATGDYAASGAVTAPGDSEGYTKCGSGNVWYKDVSDLPSFGGADFHAYYQTTSGTTTEFSDDCLDSVLESARGVYEVIPTIADYSSITLAWLGGDPPFLLSTNGVEIYLDVARTETQLSGYNGRAVTIYSNDSCGYGWLTVTDSCGSSVEIDFKAADGTWEQDYYNYTGGVFGGGTTDSREGGCPVTFYSSLGAFSTNTNYYYYGADFRMTVQWTYYNVPACNFQVFNYPYRYAGGLYDTYEEAWAKATAKCAERASETICPGSNSLAYTPGGSCVSHDALLTPGSTCTNFVGTPDWYPEYPVFPGVSAEPGYHGTIPEVLDYKLEVQGIYTGVGRVLIDKWVC